MRWRYFVLFNFKYIIKRILCLIPVLFIISFLTFSINKLIPGDPAELMLREKEVVVTEENIAMLKEEMGLNKPFIEQYIIWVKNVVRGDLGKSFRSGEPVVNEILTSFPNTMKLAVASVVVLITIAMPLGIVSALYKNSIVDFICKISSFISISMPSFWLGILLMYILAVRYEIFPIVGDKGLNNLILPSLTIGISMSGSYIRLIRRSLLDVLSENYIEYARARGLKERIIIINNALKNSFIPIVTALGMSFGHLIGGTVVVENIFSWPGLGRLILQSISNRDYPMIQGYVLVMAVVFVFVNLLVDLSYCILDPRVSLGGQSFHG